MYAPVLFKLHNLRVFMNNKIKSISVEYLIPIVVFLDLITAFTLEYFAPNNSNNHQFPSILEEILLAIILAPLVETIIFQFLLLRLLQKYVKYIYIQIFLSALVFGLAHCYSISYVIKAFLSGVLYSTLFIIVEKRGKNGFLYVLISHTMYNIIISILNHSMF